ncbi:MAG: hypothetical protein Q4D05_06860 [Acinetobacter sp.]|nr:hypothetical protein [Acinetobacter sp.]
MKSLIYQAKALKQLLKIPCKAMIMERCDTLVHFPHCANVKALKNHVYPYRLRVGDYRVFFAIVGDRLNIVSIEEVKKRDERTY